MLETEIVKLINAVEKLTDAMDALTIEVCARRVISDGGEPPEIEKAPKQSKLKVVETEQPKNQDEAPKVTDQEVKDATLAKARDGFQVEIRALMAQFGVKKRQELKEDDYPKFLEALGKIH